MGCVRGTGVPPPPCPAAVTPLPPSAIHVPGWEWVRWAGGERPRSGSVTPLSWPSVSSSVTWGGGWFTAQGCWDGAMTWVLRSTEPGPC